MQETQNKQPSRLEKIIHTWLIKAFQYQLANPNDKRKMNREKVCLNFIISIFSPQTQPNPQLIGASKNLYKRLKNTIREKLKRVSKTPKLQTLKEKYPKLEIERAYKYAVLSNKFALTNEDIETFEKIIEILALNVSKNKKDK
ncbi:hypothetical protein DMB95_06975 [Campylobacter sp. MIT 12-8780]|uniref:hypothetical protein n=1 Tax=unclassified Campylobacter TaxID=2593542 RepID=UPI00115EA485|nr:MULTISPECIES: hypothetical protein [unclassified Campylobacter]NDJ27706.1 hypothetical protein [Campylobacter sp. MIT 19-121]TQR40868.1 hypothetical protein DMB95_06975 [Campylobacter sp. MIT 12-8780]